MPIYDYLCADCDTSFDELIRSPRDEASVCCTHCGSRKVERQVSVFAMGRGRSSDSSARGGSSCASCSGGSCGSCGSRRGT